MANDLTVQAVSAAIGGATSSTLLHPLDTIKTKIQSTKIDEGQTPPTIAEVVKAIINEGGIGALYVGCLIKAMQSAVTKSIYFYNSALLGAGKFKSVFSELLVGYIAELGHLPITMPLETVANRMICSREKLSPQQAVKQLIRERGIAGFYSGLGANIAVSVQPAIHFGLFEQIKKSVAKGRPLAFWESFVYGGIARAISTLIIFPYIRAKVIAQTDPDSKGLSPAAIVRREIKRSGVAGLYGGVRPELIRGVLSTALMLAIKERIAEKTRAALARRA